MNARFLLVGLAAGLLATAADPLGAETKGALPGFAVVELFTSEGCSSCPPADAVLTQISLAASKDGLPVYALEWHVDYWDSLGWKDPFDSRAATERQYAYAKALPSSVYTPQVVINGRIVPGWAGSQGEINGDVSALVKAPARSSLHVSVLSAVGSALRVRAEVSEAPRGSRLLLLLVESGLEETPNAGENAGRRLLHSNVVRAVKVLPAATTETSIDIPAGIDLDRSRLVGVIQDPNTMAIFGADAGTPIAHAAVRLMGRVIDDAGRPVTGATIQACSGSQCVPAITNTEGTFDFEELAPGSYTLAFDAREPPVKVTLADRNIFLEQPLVAAR